MITHYWISRELKEISDKMQQEERISMLHMRWLFCRSGYSITGFISYYAAIVINIIAIASFSLDGNVMWNEQYCSSTHQRRDAFKKVHRIIDSRPRCLCPYLLLSYMVLTLPVEHKKTRRALRKTERSCLYTFVAAWWSTLRNQSCCTMSYILGSIS